MIRKLVFLLVAISTCGNAAAAHKDYSKRGGEYAILKDIRLSVRKIDFVERRQVVVETVPVEASVFQVEATVTIQTVESVVAEGSVWEDLAVRYELLVGNDVSNQLHDKLIGDLYQFWSTHSTDNSVVSDDDVSLQEGKYVIRRGRYTPRVAWFDDRFVQLSFLQFRNPKKGGFGAEQGFWENKIRFYDNGRRIKLGALVNGRQQEFLDLYRSGRFKR